MQPHFWLLMLLGLNAGRNTNIAVGSSLANPSLHSAFVESFLHGALQVACQIMLPDSGYK